MLLQIVLALLIIGVMLWVINTFVPMESRIKQLLNVAVIVIVVIWLLTKLGVWAYLASIG